jgi:DNA-directed RNA polymerase alpha subunit
MNSKEFSLLIESIVKEKRVSYMEAIVDYCENNDIDLGSVKSIVNKSLKEKIKLEATDLKMLKEKKGGVLPV